MVKYPIVHRLPPLGVPEYVFVVPKDPYTGLTHKRRE